MTYSDNAKRVYERLYLARNSNDEIIETIPQCHERVAKFLAETEEEYDQFYNLLQNKIFRPNTPCMANAGVKKNPMMMACFVTKLEDSMDSIIDDLWATCPRIYKDGGGTGIPITNLRRKGALLSSGGQASGPLSYMKVIEEISNQVKSGGKQRRAANLIAAKHNHPDIVDIVNCKRDKQSFKSMNLSVTVDNNFMENVIQMTSSELQNPIVKLIDPKEGGIGQLLSVEGLWNHITRAAWETGDPGLIFIDKVNEDNPLYPDIPIECLNPCMVGNTKVAVADGRGSVEIEKLAEEGKDVDVFCIENDELSIQKMRNPRKTGVNVNTVRVHLDSGDYLDVTKNHKFVLLNNTEKEAKDLKPNDKLKVASRVKVQNSTKQYWVWNYITKEYNEHRMIAGTPDDMICHHKDENGLNNRPKNLKNISRPKHNTIHSESFSGEKNGNFSGISNDEMKKHGLYLTKQLGRRFSINDWIDYGIVNDLPLPTKFTEYRKSLAESFRQFSIDCAKEIGIGYADIDPRVQKTLIKATEQGYNADIKKGQVFVQKICEGCKKSFVVLYQKRETSFCGRACASQNTLFPYPTQLVNLQKQKNDKTLKAQITVFKDLQKKLNREPMKKEWCAECKNKSVPYRIGKGSPFLHWNDFKEAACDGNHRVTKIENLGKADVYNGTVDKAHNMLIGGFKGLTHKNNEKYSYINTLNCGESCLHPNGSCNLGHLNLNQTYLEHLNFYDIVYWAILFLNRIIDKTSYPTPGFEYMMKKYRPIGLGLMGFSDYLFKRKIAYGSEESIKSIDSITKTLSDYAFQASAELVQQGKIPGITFDTSKHIKRFQDKVSKFSSVDVNDHRLPGNMTVTTIAPTGSTAISADCSYSIEPHFALAWTKQLDDGGGMDFLDETFDKELNKVLCSGKYSRNYYGVIEEIKRNKGTLKNTYFPEEYQWIRDVFVTAHDIPNQQRLEMQAAAQKNITMSISSTINLPNSATIEDIKNIYLTAYQLGLKGITIYRDGCLDNQPVNFGTDNEQTETKENLFGVNYKRPMERVGKVMEVSTPAGKLYVRGSFDNNHLMEVFLDVGQQGSRENVLFNGLGRVISRSLQRGVDLSDITDTLRGSGGDTFFVKLDNGASKSRRVDGILDAVAYILDEKFNIPIQEEHTEQIVDAVQETQDRCPVCQKFTLTRSAGCRNGICTNPACAYSACS